MEMDQTPGRVWLIDTVILLPGATGSETAVEGTGISSYQAEYDALPLASTSCSVPACTSVSSVSAHEDSRQPPPIPTHVADDSASPALAWVAVGTVQVPLTEVKSLPFSIAPWL